MTRSRPRRRLGWAWLLLAAALVGAGVFFWLRSRGTAQAASAPAVETASASRGLFRVSVTGPGTLEAARTLNLQAGAQGTLTQLPAVGDRVQKGQLIARVDPGSYQRAVENARLALAKARAQLESSRLSQTTNVAQQQQGVVSAQTQYASAQNQSEAAQANLSATRRLFAVGGASQQALSEALRGAEQAQANLQSARVSLDTARQSLSLRQSGNVQDLKNQELAVQQAEISLRNAQQDLADTKLFAPFDGVVSAVNGQVGAAAGNAALLTLINDSVMHLPVQIDETEIGRVQTGMRAEVTLDALEGRAFRGRVIRVAPAARVVQNIAVFDVTVALDNPERTLRPGMSAEAEIIAEEIRDAVLVPLRAVEKVRNRGYVQVQGEAERRRVRTGPDDGTQIVITSGLEPGEAVVLPARARPASTTQRTGQPGGFGLPTGAIRVPAGGGR